MTDTYRLFISDSTVSDPDGDVIIGPNSVVIVHGLTFTGKRRIDYGESRNANLLHMLENFASEEVGGAPPTDVIEDGLIGQLWYNKTDGNLKVFDGTDWVNVAIDEVSAADVTFDPAGTNLTATNMQAAIAELDSRVGNLVYDEENYVTNGPTVTAAINSLDIALQQVADDLDAITPINAYRTIAPGSGATGSAQNASGLDTFQLRTANNRLTISIGSSGGKHALFTLREDNINHNNLNAYVLNEHVNHATVNINAGNGLTGGGNILSSKTINLGLPLTLAPGVNNINQVTATQHRHQVNFPVTSVNGQFGDVVIPSSTDYNAVGSHVFAYVANGFGIVEGNTYAGSGLHPAGSDQSGFPTAPDENRTSNITRGAATLSGTWRALGRTNRRPFNTRSRATLFVRIS